MTWLRVWLIGAVLMALVARVETSKGVAKPLIAIGLSVIWPVTLLVLLYCTITGRMEWTYTLMRISSDLPFMPEGDSDD